MTDETDLIIAGLLAGEIEEERIARFLLEVFKDDDDDDQGEKMLAELCAITHA